VLFAAAPTPPRLIDRAFSAPYEDVKLKTK
jgi:hypothetical protein